MVLKIKSAISDIAAAQRKLPLIHLLGWQEIKHRYKRSLLGPFWLTISMGVQLATIFLVFGSILQAPMVDYIPYVTAAMITWAAISSTLLESCGAFLSSSSMIKQMPVPLFVYVQKVVWRNILMYFHNIVLFPIAMLLVHRPINGYLLYIIPGSILFILNILWISLVLAVLSARYRDLPMTVNSVIPVFVYITPIMWLPDMMPGHFGTGFVDFNPVYHLLQLVCAPLLGQIPSATTWIACSTAAVIGWAWAIALYARSRDRIVFWL
jgi:lipopolysaccharide transport system permease protein